MKRIVWLVQQTERVGGTEMVSINLLRGLRQYCGYETTLISIASKPEKSFFDIDDLNILYLDVPMEVVRFDEFLNKYFLKKQYLKAISLIFKTIYHFIIKKRFYRKKIQSLTNKDDIVIASSLDSYLFAPKKRNVYFHFHFDSKDYLDPFFQLMMKMCINPRHVVFLTNHTRNEVIKKKPSLAKKSVFIYNPSRYKSEYIKAHKKLNFIFVGRLEKQKNPELLIEVAKKIKDSGFLFHLDICGDGSKRETVAQMIKSYDLQDEVTMNGMVSNIEDYYRKSDGQIVTSITEGYALSIVEANCFSLFSISTRCGDSIYEVIKDGVNGIVIDSFDPQTISERIIKTFSSNYDNLKLNAYNYSFNYNLEQIVYKWDKLFKSGD